MRPYVRCAALKTSPLRVVVALAVLGLGSAPALAQQRAFVVAPSVRVTETITDNVNLNRSGGNSSGSEWITQINPMLRLESHAARVDGMLNIGFLAANYANGKKPDTTQTMLNGSGKVVLWENRVFLDMTGSISRQPTYSFGPRPADSVTGTSNLSEIKLFTISPYVVQRFAGTGTVEGRFTLTESDSNQLTVARNQTNIWSLNAADPYAMGNLGWRFEYLDRHTEITNRRDMDITSMRFSGTYAVSPQLNIRLISGTESNNYSSIDKRSTSIYGFGADWKPSPFTKVSGSFEDRFFGAGYSLRAEHQDGRMAFQGTMSRDAMSMAQSMLGAYTWLDLVKFYCNSKPASERAACLASNPYPNANDAIVGLQSVVSNGYYLERRIQMGATLHGLRSSLGIIAFRSDRDTLTENNFVVNSDTVSTSTYKTVGVGLTASHKLTPITSANASVTTSQGRTNGVNAVGVVNNTSARTNTITAGVTTSFAPKTTGLFNVRSNRGSGVTSYSENALMGSVIFQF